MPLSEVALERFGGLDLVTDPGEIGDTGAVDLLDVDFDRLGRVKSRQGFVKHTLLAGGARFDSLHAFGQPSGADVLVAGAGLSVQALAGGAPTHSTSSNASPHYFTGFGTATEPRVYVANGADSLRYYTTTGFTTPTTTGVATVNGKFLATQQPDNRLVVARFPAERSRVRFSDAGDPHTFGTNNRVDLDPGDGEEITALVSWREYVFAFKQTKFFVFYGNDTDTSGEPIFNVRGVYGAGVRLGNVVTAGVDGVYFLDRRGVYRTTGGNPVLLSRQVEPLFAPISDSSSSRIDGDSGALPQLHWADDRLYLAYSTGGPANNRVLVHHTSDGWWSLWNVGASALVTARVSATDPLEESLLFAYSSATNDVGRFTDAVTDAGAPIASRYQFGFMDFGDSTRKVLRDVMLDGTGRINVAVGTNFGVPDDGKTVALSSTVPGRGRARRAYRGHNFTIRLSSVGGSAWQVNRLVNMVWARRELGVE